MKIKIAEIRAIRVDSFNRGLLEQAKAVDMVYSRLGEHAPRKRLLHVDYKERGQDMNRSHVIWQPVGVSDEEMISHLMRVYKEQGCIVSAIIEVDDECQMMGVHYVRPGFTEECRRDVMELFQEQGFKGKKR